MLFTLQLLWLTLLSLFRYINDDKALAPSALNPYNRSTRYKPHVKKFLSAFRTFHKADRVFVVCVLFG